MRIVVLGTGTHVGKTYFTRQLALSLRALAPQLALAALKPIESGFERAASDAAALAEVSCGVELPQPHPLYALADAVSPHLAARRAGLEITPSAVRAWFDAWLNAMTPHVASRHVIQIVESAGACFSPLSQRSQNFDLAVALEPAIWILVAHDGLGVLHDLGTTLALMKARGRSPDHVALCAARPADASTGTNAAELAQLGITKVSASLGADQRDLSAFAELLLRDARLRSTAPGSPGS